MSYDTYEQSVQNGRPKYRVLFALGSDEYRYSNDEKIVADSNGAWIPEAISFSEFSQTNEMAKDPLTITLPRDTPICLNFRSETPEEVCSVTVYRLHTNDIDEEFRVWWKGRVAGVSGDGDIVKFNCENIFTSMRRPALSARYQKSCRHALYQPGCNLDKADFGTAAIATAVDGLYVTVSYTPDSNAPDFTGGMLEMEDGALRYIISHGSTLKLIRPMQALADLVNSSEGEAQVTLYPGCAHTMDACKEFGNIENYGGFPWIPSKNPFGNDVTGSVV